MKYLQTVSMHLPSVKLTNNVHCRALHTTFVAPLGVLHHCLKMKKTVGRGVVIEVIISNQVRNIFPGLYKAGFASTYLPIRSIYFVN